MATQTKTKKTAKTSKSTKSVKKTGNAKAKTIAKSRNAKRKARIEDDAREVGKHFSTLLTPSQVRILRGLRKAKTAVNRTAIKSYCGMSPEDLYSKSWLNGLLDLAGKDYAANGFAGLEYIKIETGEAYGERGYMHSLTAKGKQALESAEKKAKTAK